MLLNYHEMTMNEPRNSQARQNQYLVICTVMAATFVYYVLQAGGLATIDINKGVFPGGTFVHKYTQRDYAAAGSLAEQIAKDAGLNRYNETLDAVYSLYLDDPNLMSGRRQRFACGLLGHDDKAAKLLATNKGRVPPTKQELEDDGAFKLWPKLMYQETVLPANTPALVVQFPFTNGFVSAMLLGWRVIPALRAAALQAGADAAVVLSTCSVKAQVCTHYAPLIKLNGAQSSPFLLNLPDTDAYLQALPEEATIDFVAAWNKMQRRLATWSIFQSKQQEGKKKGADEL